MAKLEELLVSGAALDRDLVAGALKPFVRIDQETGAIRFTAAWHRVPNEPRIIAYLLARKARVALGFDNAIEAASPSEIIKDTGIPKGSVHYAMKHMYEARPQLVDKDASSCYWVPNWAVDGACEVLPDSAEE